MHHIHQRNRAITAIILISAVFAIMNIQPAYTITWASATTRLTTYSWFDGYPSITSTSDGRIWVVWSRAVNGYMTLYYQFSSNMGYSWSTPSNLTTVPDVYENTRPSIVQTTNGTLWAVWASNSPPPPPPPKPDFSLSATPNSLTIQQSSSGTSTITVKSLYGFDKAVNLVVSGMPSNVSAALDPPQVTPPPNGNINSTLQVSVGANALPGSYVLTVTGTSTGLPPIVRTVNVTLNVTQSGASSYRTSHYLSEVEAFAEEASSYDYEIFYRTSSDNGASWSGIVQLTNNNVDDLAPTVLQLRNGTISVFWQSQSEIFYKYSSDSGGSWVTKQLTVNSYTDSCPAAIQASDESIWVAWESYRGTNYDIYYRVFDGSTWLSEQRLTTSSDVDSSPSILETVDGLKWMFWTRTGTTEDSTDDLYYSFLSGGSWSTATQLTTVDTNNDQCPTTRQIRDNSVWVAWSSNRTGNYEIFYKTSLIGDLTGPENPIGSQSYPPDGSVNIYDLVFMREAYGAKQGDVDWIEYEIADITGPENPINSRKYPPDNVVSAYDLFALGKNYGKS